MSKAYASPTARLIQGSRLFALPKPLPPPPQTTFSDRNGIVLRKGSDTATKPYPLHQAIETPATSQAIGQWGLKRHLPLRTTKRASVPLRILAQDTNDHVTDFASAGDHDMSLAKFQELSIPLLKRQARNTLVDKQKIESAYEDALDNTDRAQHGARWKNGGPWLSGMLADDLDSFLEQVKKQRTEWQSHITLYFKQREFAAARKATLSAQGYYGPLELQPLDVQANIRRDRVIQQAEHEIEALPQSVDESALAQQRHEIMRKAQEEARKFELELEERARRLGAKAVLEKADRRVGIALSFAKTEYQQALKAAQGKSHLEESALQRHADHQEEASVVAYKAFVEILQRFGEGEDGVQDAELERRARELVQTTTAAMEAAEKDRLAQLAEWEVQQRKIHTPSPEKVQELQKELRDAHKREGISSELTTMLVQFLDLPGLANAESRRTALSRAAGVSQTQDMKDSLFSITSDNQAVPLSTHPGAGLGYLRSIVHMENHPVYGPQARRSPVLSRVVRPRMSVLGADFNAKVGVGGFVALDAKGSSANHQGQTVSHDPNDPEQMAATLDPYKEGGNKMYLQADSASIDEAGKVHIKVVRPDKEAIAVKTGELAAVLGDKTASMRGPTSLNMADFGVRFPGPNDPAAKYGAGLPSYRTPLPR